MKIGGYLSILFIIIAISLFIIIYRNQYNLTMSVKNIEILEISCAISVLLAEIIFIVSEIYNFELFEIFDITICI